MENVINTIERYYPLSNQAKELILSQLEPMTLKKGDILIPELKASPYIFFVEKGALKNNHFDELGNKSVVWFGFEGSIFFSVSAYFETEYFPEVVEAFEDCLVYKAPIKYFRQLMRENMEWAQWGRYAIEDLTYKLILEMDKNRPLNAKARYLNLIQSNEDIKTRASQKDIASYLGVSPVTISRFKKEML